MSSRPSLGARTALLITAGLLVALLSPEGRVLRLSRECADLLEVSPADAEGSQGPGVTEAKYGHQQYPSAVFD